MKIAAVIPCREEALTISRLLDALASQTRPADELIIVDDRSTDGTAGVVEHWRQAHATVDAHVIPGPGRGIAAAMNTGIAASAADIIVRLDGHSAPSPDYIARCLDALADPRAGVVGGVWQIESGAPTPVARAIARVVSHPLGSGGAQYRHAETAALEPVSVETVPFGTFRKSLWRELGGFDEALMTNEDYDFNYRARRAGADVRLDGRIRSTYRARPTLTALARQYHRYGFWKARMLRKDVRAVRLRQIAAAGVLPWVAVTTAAAILLPGPTTRALALLYPSVVALGAAQIVYQARSLDLFAAVCAALAAVHLSWSAGFVRALAGGRPPDASVS